MNKQIKRTQPAATQANQRPKKNGLLKILLLVLFLSLLVIMLYVVVAEIKRRKSPVVKPPYEVTVEEPEPAELETEQEEELQPEPGFYFANAALIEATKNFADLVYGGAPKPGKKSDYSTLSNTSYYSGYSAERGNPLWVGYRLDAVNTQKRKNKRPSFRDDSRISLSGLPSVYTKSGYDRGHLAPNAPILHRYGVDGQRETFLMSNIIPQTPTLNRRIWVKTERLEEQYSEEFGKVYVFAGPVFGQNPLYLQNKVEIPEASYKIIINESKDGGSFRVLPMLIPQTVSGLEKPETFLTSIDAIEKATGLNFFEPMLDHSEDKLEAEVHEQLW